MTQRPAASVTVEVGVKPLGGVLAPWDRLGLVRCSVPRRVTPHLEHGYGLARQHCVDQLWR